MPRFPSPRLLLSALALSTLVRAEVEVPLATLVRTNLEFAAAQHAHLLAATDAHSGYPRSAADDQVTFVGPNDWTSGFFPGSLWFLYEATGKPEWRDAAARLTAGLESVKNNRRTHDVGFMLYCSYGNGLRLTHNPAYRDVLLAGAESLSSRFNPTVGCIQSWDRADWAFPVIIDNMMNLELLTWAARAANEPRYRTIAVAHADTTLRNHFRADGSSYHVVNYDPATGQAQQHVTHQGAADTSAWARGQMWGLYGYTLMYRETRNPRYLQQARTIADFVLGHPRLPADLVPYWDFDAPNLPDAPRDTAAAAIMCSALFELSDYVDPDAAIRYRSAAQYQLRSLASPAYRAALGENHGFLLQHATGHLPMHSEIDVPLIYADYYFLEALLRCREQLAHDPM